MAIEAREALSEELSAIKSVCSRFGVRAHVFLDEYSFEKGKESQMMAEVVSCINGCDFLIAEVSKKAIGVGCEVGIAAALGKPVIYCRQAGSPASLTVGGLASFTLTYSEANELARKLSFVLENRFFESD
ncbi:MAG: hypothetical protein RLZZ360_382 [Candidatus Parcubacteria bacterium]|jgi:nucleoside 2-deoxyribosyltransferase